MDRQTHAETAFQNGPSAVRHHSQHLHARSTRGAVGDPAIRTDALPVQRQMQGLTLREYLDTDLAHTANCLGSRSDDRPSPRTDTHNTAVPTNEHPKDRTTLDGYQQTRSTQNAVRSKSVPTASLIAVQSPLPSPSHPPSPLSTPSSQRRRLRAKKKHNDSNVGASRTSHRHSMSPVSTASKSPRTKSKGLRSCHRTSPAGSTASQKSPRSLRSPTASRHRRRSISSASPRPSPRQSSKLQSPRQRSQPRLPFDDCEDVSANSGSTANTNTTNGINHNDNRSQDDNTSRMLLQGYRGGQAWNIMDDTPAGHAQKIKIVRAIEFDDDDDDDDDDDNVNGDGDGDDDGCGDMNENTIDDASVVDPPSLDEDSDIQDESERPPRIDFQQQHAATDDLNDQQRTRSRTMSLPSDPVETPAPHGRMTRRGSMQDRFAASFVNTDVWTSDDDTAIEHARKPVRTHSGDISIMTDQDTTQGVRIKTRCALEQQQQRIVGSQSGVPLGAYHNNKGSGNNMNCHVGTTMNRHNNTVFERLDRNGHANDGDDASSEMLEKLRDAPSSTRLKRRNHTALNAGRSNARSGDADVAIHEARRRLGDTAPSNRRGIRSSKNRARLADRRPIVPATIDNVPTTPMVEISMSHRSPLSSSLTSTPNSRSHPASDRRKSKRTVCGISNNLSNNLSQFIEEENGHFDDALSVDGHTLGASTITTNFSTTQRTRGDNTVSTRSLFAPSESMRVSETPKPPMRRSEQMIDEDGEYDVRSPTIRDHDIIGYPDSRAPRMVLRKPSMDKTSQEMHRSLANRETSDDSDASEASSVDSTQRRQRIGTGMGDIETENEKNGHSNSMEDISTQSTTKNSSSGSSDDPFDGMAKDDFDSVFDDHHRKRKMNKLGLLKKVISQRKIVGVVPLTDDDGAS